MSYPIFPSLSRSPDFATTRKIEDGTISSPMESGYVTTRPRFTRLRRTWGVSWKNLVAEDVRALDRFETSVVMGGAGAFYLPNLIQNGGFEFNTKTLIASETQTIGGISGNVVTLSYITESGTPLSLVSPDGTIYPILQFQFNSPGIATAVVLPTVLGLSVGMTVTINRYSITFDGWSQSPPNDEAMFLGVGAGDDDGAASVLFQSTPNYTVAPGVSPSAGAILTGTAFPVSPGDSLWFAGRVKIIAGMLPAGITFSTQPFFTFNGSRQVYPTALSADTGGVFIDYPVSLTVPPGCSTLTVGLLTFVSNSNSTPTVLNGTQQVYWDSLALSVIAAAQPYGKMPGSSPPSSAVRFTKPLNIKDAKWAEGASRYDVTCEVTEL